MSTKAKITALLIFKSVLLAGGLFALFIGYLLFDSMGGGFGGWLIWGIASTITLPLELIKNLISGAREGAIEGANTYKIVDWGDKITVSNSPNVGALRGMLLTVAAMILLGPVLLIFKIIGNIAVVVQCAVALNQIKKAN